MNKSFVKSFIRPLIFFTLFLFFAKAAYAETKIQQAGDSTAIIYGYISDNYGFPVPDAYITFTDESDITNVLSGTTDSVGRFEITIVISSIKDISHGPEKFTLYQNYPNPFNPTTIIPFYIEKPGFVSISIYNILGQKVKTLVKAN
ncbi:hypothetical protein ACFL4T_14685, partial [candidate division KSB1 bacterium]